MELVEGVELGADGVLPEGLVEDGAEAGFDDEESLVDGAAGLSEDFVEPLSEAFLESDFESDAESLEVEEESLELESLDESLEPELLGA